MPYYESSDFEATRSFYTRVLGREEGQFGGGYIGFGSGQAQVVFAPPGVEPVLPDMGVDVDSRGAVDIVTDAEILAAQSWLATNEGIFVEPASAAPVAGLMKSCDAARAPAFPFTKIPQRSRIVCTVTGHGLKDPDIISAQAATLETIPANADAVLRAIGF